VNLYGDLRKYLPLEDKGAFGLRVPAGIAVRDVLNYFKIPPGTPLAIVVNGVHCDDRFSVSHGDVLSVFSMSAFEPPSSE